MPDSSRSDPAASKPTLRLQRWWHEPIMWLVVGGPVLVVLAGIVTAWLAASGADPLVSAPDAGRRVERALEPALKARNAASTEAAQPAAAHKSTNQTASER